MSTDSKASRQTAEDLLRFIDEGPTPFHCVDEVRRRVGEAGFTGLDEQDLWTIEAGQGYFVTRGDGSIVLFRAGVKPPGEAGFRLVAAHTDSPNLRLKPQMGRSKEGYLILDVEVYGGATLATWADRDLGLAGRVFVDEKGGLTQKLVRIDRPLCRIPNVAIHLNRTVNEKGLLLDKHKHLSPAVALWPSDDDPNLAVARLVAEAIDVEPDALRGHDLCLYDVQRGVFSGANDEFLQVARLDNQVMCHCALAALLYAPDGSDTTNVVVLFDHEEIGSASHRGAAGPLLRDILTRIVEAIPTPGGLTRALARSMLVSADMAHAVHPTQGELHDGVHLPRMNGGPVVKTNANQRYATDAESGAIFRSLCRGLDIPCQEFVMRADMACGSTIGPISAAGLGVRTVDVGNAMLSMHSAREMAGAQDPHTMTRVMTAFFTQAF